MNCGVTGQLLRICIYSINASANCLERIMGSAPGSRLPGAAGRAPSADTSAPSISWGYRELRDAGTIRERHSLHPTSAPGF